MTMRWFLGCLAFVCWLGYAGSPYQILVDGQPMAFDTAEPVVFTLDANPLNSSYSNAAATSLAREAFAAWNAVPGSALRITENASGTQAFSSVAAILGLQAAGGSAVIFDTTGQLSQLAGLAPDDPGIGFPNIPNGKHWSGFLAVFNGPALVDYSPERLRGLMMHVFGQALGLSFSSVNGPRIGEPGVGADVVEVMYPDDLDGAARRALTADDRSGFLRLYGTTPQGSAGLGALAGKVFLSDGFTPAGGVGVVARNQASPFVFAYGAVTDPNTGEYSIPGMEPGDYTVEIRDVAAGVDWVHGLPLRTDQPEPSGEIVLDEVYRAKVIGPFPGPSEFFNGENESNNPTADNPEVATAVTVTADATTENIDVIFNRPAESPFTRMIYPWISNAEGSFESVLILNNLDDAPVDVVLTARRGDGQRETITRQVSGNGMLEERASTLFPTLGSGPGYSVMLEAPTAAIRGRWVTNSLRAASGASPSQGLAVRIPDSDDQGSDRAGKRILLGFLPRGSGRISAPVLVNLDDTPATLTLRFYDQAGNEVGNTQRVDQAPFVPSAAVTNDIVSGEADLYMIAETSGNLMTGVSFVFDPTFFETAIGNADVPDGAADSPASLVFPWVSNRQNQFESLLIVNNYGQNPVDVTLTARRLGGTQDTATRSIPANGFLLERAGEMFAALGSGAGYAVEVTASANTIAGQWITNNLEADSGQSPSAGVAVPRNESSTRAGSEVTLGYLPVTGAQTSAPVIVNLGDQPVDVTLRFFDTRGNLILEDRDSVTNLAPLEPFAVLANTLLPAWSENVYVTLISEQQPITAVVFVFDSTFFEPAIGNGTHTTSMVTASVIAFENVNLVTMESDSVTPNQTVLVRDGRIVAIGAAGSVPVPEEAQIIDGTGKYLMPGLTDAHTHVIDAGDLVMLLANGVTSVLNPGDNAKQSVLLKRQLRDGVIEGPTVYAGQQIYGITWTVNQPDLVVANAEDVNRVVADLAAAGYEYLKPYEDLTLEMMAAMKEAGERHGLSMVGHLSSNVGLAQHFENGYRMVAHVEELINNVFIPRINPNQIPGVIDTFLEHGAYITTTLSVVEALSIYGQNQAGYQQLLQRPGVEYLDPWQRAAWDFDALTRQVNGAAFAPEVTFMIRVAKEMMEGGVPVLLGTDTPLVGLPPGFSLHEETRILADSGWTPYQILQAGSVNFGRFIKETTRNAESFGTIAEGSRADFILTNTNPLENIANTQDRVGVMAKGKWFSEETLQQMLEDVRLAHQEQ